MSSASDEFILAQEQAVVCRHTGLADELRTALDVSGKQSEGTLVLTNKRLIYAHGAEEEEKVRVGLASGKTIIFVDIESLDRIRDDMANLSIEISSITKVMGHKRFGMDPKLVVTWPAGSGERTSEFIEQLTGGSRKKNLNDWAAVIERLKAGTQKLNPLPPTPDESTLEGKSPFRVLSDMQEKGELTIETDVEKQYKIDVEPDDVEAACGKLAEQGLVKSVSPSGEEPFYQKVSPLGEDSLDA